jgi:hypothetical protein
MEEFNCSLTEAEFALSAYDGGLDKAWDLLVSQVL